MIWYDIRIESRHESWVEGFGVFTQFMRSAPCCLDAGFGRPLQERLKLLDEPKALLFFYWVQLSQVELLTVVVLFVAFCCFMQAFREFVQVASTTCRDSRLGIFKMECSHHTNKSISESCQHLGTAKTWHKLAAESLLGQYEKQLSKIVSKWPGIELSTR